MKVKELIDHLVTANPESEVFIEDCEFGEMGLEVVIVDNDDKRVVLSVE